MLGTREGIELPLTHTQEHQIIASDKKDMVSKQLLEFVRNFGCTVTRYAKLVVLVTVGFGIEVVDKLMIVGEKKGIFEAVALDRK